MAKETETVYVGRKLPMSYVLAVVMSFTTTGTKEVTLKARGRAITTAVDVAEIARRRFLENVKIGKVNIGTEEIAQEEGGSRMVSTAEITLTRE